MSALSLYLEESLIRVVAIGIEGLAKSHPTRSASTKYRDPAGYVEVEVFYRRPHQTDLELSAVVSFIRWDKTLFWGRWAFRAKRWSDRFDGMPSQAEAEKIAAHAFTGPYPTEHVSTKSVHLAREMIMEAVRRA